MRFAFSAAAIGYDFGADSVAVKRAAERERGDKIVFSAAVGRKKSVTFSRAAEYTRNKRSLLFGFVELPFFP